MSFDISRFTFDPWKNYSGVVMEQGRVQLDSDWNEWLAELSRRIQAGTLDIMGHATYPPTTPSAFLITATSGTPNTVTIGLGRMYVDGLLAENHGLSATASWDPALAELSGTPQPPNTANPNPNPIAYTSQPYLPGATLPTGAGSYLAYLDVWKRAVTYLEDPDLVDKAVGVDTTGRLQTVWQVKLLPLDSGSSVTCATADSDIDYPAPSAGRLTTGVVANPVTGPCCLTDGTGYTGVENQCYRVEIHQPGQGSGTASLNGSTFKWSRDNASVETGVTAITAGTNSLGANTSLLTVLSLGRDQVLGFKPGDWIELLDDWSELWGNPGALCQIDGIDFSANTITLVSTVNTTPSVPATGTAPTFPVGAGGLTDPTRHTRIRRWDQAGKVYDSDGNVWWDLASSTNGSIPVPGPGTTLVLESGVTVNFTLDPTTGGFNVGDFWSFAARTADGSVEVLDAAPPIGIHHHYTKLSVVAFTNPAGYTDCRTPWNPGGGEECGCCCTATVGDNKVSFGKYSTIQDAVNAVRTGGEICLLPGLHYGYVTLRGLKDVVIHGCGSQTRLASHPADGTAGGPTKNPIQTESGLAAIITAVACRHVEFRNFAIEAANGEVGILLDSLADEEDTRPKSSNKEKAVSPEKVQNVDITIHDLVITASDLPAILAAQVELLNISNNRIAMRDESGTWASVYVSGNEIHVKGNWIGLQDADNATDWIPATVVKDVPAGFNTDKQPPSPAANGGIHVAGASEDVYILENEIEGGARNGITLGSFALIQPSGLLFDTVTGLLASQPDPAATTSTLLFPATVSLNGALVDIVAGDVLQNIQIANNRIRNMGLCGIGPVGFFNLQQTTEVISIQNLIITDNTISSTLQLPLAPLPPGITSTNTSFGYGAICLPDVQNLIVRDNIVTDFGNLPGTAVCGIFLLHGEQVEISRNQVIETRDWTGNFAEETLSTTPQAGILVTLVTPPLLDQMATAPAWSPKDDPPVNPPAAPTAPPIYQPGLPSLRIESNVVRVALGPSLQAEGYGPFFIAQNHLSSGGPISAPNTGITGTSGTPYGPPLNFYAAYLNVLIANLGVAIDLDGGSLSFTDVYNRGNQSPFRTADTGLSNSSSGAVHFSNNICQLETRASGIEGFASIAILSLDDLTFTGNNSWVDGTLSAIYNAMLMGITVLATGNRLQEGGGAVEYSGFTWGGANITTHNICTHCIIARSTGGRLFDSPNVVLQTYKDCPK